MPQLRRYLTHGGPHQPVNEISEGYQSQYDYSSQGRMILEEVLGVSHDLGAKNNNQDRQNAEANQTSNNDGQQEEGQAHLKDASGEDKELERCGWRQGGGKHQGQELLPFESVPDALELGLVDAFEQEELTAGSSQVIRQEAAQG